MSDTQNYPKELTNSAGRYIRDLQEEAYDTPERHYQSTYKMRAFVCTACKHRYTFHQATN